ncbi:MAG: glycosyltransferase [Alphaproteobacteria bacterium]|nr:glycosyltransferase [Alphaproteobacteria bacterium]
MPKISVIVPVYNVEKFLPKCLDSILNQTFKDFEVIILDDGSTDKSAKILDEYAKKETRFKIIHKENSGYGSSMNLGISQATGDYISIVEPDDFIDETMFEKLYSIANKEKADVVKSNYYSFVTATNKSTPKIGIKEDTKISNPNIKDILTLLKLGPTIWTALYRRAFLVQNNIQFLNSPGASYQDLGFNFKTLIMAKKIALTNQAYYHYRTDNEGSSVKNPNKIFCVCDEFKEIERYIKEQNKYEELKTILPIAKYSNYMWNYKRLPFKAKLKFLEVFQTEFSMYQQEGLLSPTTLGKKKYKRLQKLIKNPTLFYIIYELEHLPHQIIQTISKIKGKLS